MDDPRFTARLLSAKTQDTITMSWKNDFPIMIEERGKQFNIQTFIAPMMGDATDH